MSTVAQNVGTNAGNKLKQKVFPAKVSSPIFLGVPALDECVNGFCE